MGSDSHDIELQATASTTVDGPGGSLEGHHIGRHQVLGLAGAGGMAEVYVGYDPLLDRSVAIKRLLPEGGHDEIRAQRLRQEAQLHGALVHPNIARVYDLVTRDGVDYIVIEYIDGQTLQQLLERGPLSLRRGLEIIHDIASGLSFAHGKNIIHRDLKVQNVLIEVGGTAKLIDFGLSRLAHESANDSGDKNLTEPGTLVGTYQNMSPEQAWGQVVDHRSDLFSLGILAYEVFTGVAPFDADSPGAVLERIRNHQQTPLRNLVPEAPIELSELIDQLLAKKRILRPQSTRDVADTFGRLLADVQGRHTALADQQTFQVSVVYYGMIRDDRDESDSAAILELHEHARHAAQELDGTVVYAAGAEGMVCFGYPRGRTNSAHSAGQLATHLLEAMPVAATAGRIRVAIDVGEVTAHTAGKSTLLVGPPIDTASSLARTARPGSPIASWRAQIPLARFYRMVGEASAAGAPGAHLYRLVEAIDPSLPADPNRRAGFIGREHELSTLERDWATICAAPVGQAPAHHGGSGRVLTIEGEAGIGKTSLAQAFAASVSDRGGRQLMTHANPRDRYAPFEVIRRLLLKLPGVRGAHDGAATRSEFAQRFLAADGWDPELIAAVAHVFGIASEEDRAVLAAMTDATSADAIAKRVAWFLLQANLRQPVLLLIEDLHWMDHSSQSVIAEVVANITGVPLYLVLTFRPEVVPAWLGASGVTRLALGRMNADEAPDMCQALPLRRVRPTGT